MDYALYGNKKQETRKSSLGEISLNITASVKVESVNLIMQCILYHTEKLRGVLHRWRLIVVLRILSS